MERYVVMAFYPNLGIKVRFTEYDWNERDEMCEYIGGLRLTETPYVAFDRAMNEVLEKENYDLSFAKMSQMLEEVD